MTRQDPNNYWEQLERLEKLIRASEFKAGVVFSFHSLILGLFVDRLDQFKEVFLQHTVLLVLLILWLLMVAISIYFCFRCFRPAMEMEYEKNVFFFSDAAKEFGSTEAYTEELIRVCGSEKEFYKALAEQIHAESKIIDVKFLNVRRSILFFAISFIVVFCISFYWVLFT